MISLLQVLQLKSSKDMFAHFLRDSKNYNLTISVSKFIFAWEKLQFFGHEISPEGVF